MGADGESLRRDRAATQGAVAAAGWLVLWTIVDVAVPASVVPDTLFGLAPLIACAVLPAAVTAAFAAAAVILVTWSGWWNGTWGSAQQWLLLLDVCLVGAAAVGIAYVRVRREHQFARVAAIAETAQKAILPAVPATVEGAQAAARYLSAAEDATVGGDLYDACLEGHTRFIVGDVKGKGIAAVEEAARVIRAFRQTAAAQVQLADVAAGMHHYLVPFFGDEEFATALLVELGPTSITLTSCGHPPAILVTSRGEATYLDVPPGLPLGIGDDFQQVTIPWEPGDRLLLYTDGLSEARDGKGEFLPLLDIAPKLASGTPEQALDTLLDEVRRHVPRAHLGDDLAVLLLERDLGPAAAVDAAMHSETTGTQFLAPARVLTGDLPARGRSAASDGWGARQGEPGGG